MVNYPQSMCTPNVGRSLTTHRVRYKAYNWLVTDGLGEDMSSSVNCLKASWSLANEISIKSNHFAMMSTNCLHINCTPSQLCHNERDGVPNHQPHDCLPNRLFRRRSKKISKLRVTGLCAGNSPVTGEIPAQRASNAENVSIWRNHQHFPRYWPFVRGMNVTHYINVTAHHTLIYGLL